MGFKLGASKSNYAVGGEIKNKLRFGKMSGSDASVPGVPVIRKPLEEGIMGEANMDGSIFISDKLQPGSKEEQRVLIHGMRHATDMKIGKLKYDDNSVTYNGEVFPREDINGKDMIKIDGKWKEVGDEGFPWENDANNGNDEGYI